MKPPTEEEKRDLIEAALATDEIWEVLNRRPAGISLVALLRNLRTLFRSWDERRPPAKLKSFYADLQREVETFLEGKPRPN